MSACDSLRIIGSPGTNKVMAAEFIRLCQRAISQRPPAPRKVGSGMLVYPFEPEQARVAVHYLRTATRAQWDLFRSDAPRLEPLYDELVDDVAADRRDWLWDGARISVRARNVAGFAAGERQIVGTVKNALLDGAEARGIRLEVDPQHPDIHVSVRQIDDELLVSVDLAGASLSQRGYRADRGAAPLREHLAAVLLMLARHDPRSEPLLDPMCGAGTIAIEAALMARAAPLGEHIHTAAYRVLPRFSERGEAPPLDAPLFADTRATVLGNELDGRTLDAARHNAHAAGLGGDDACTWLRGDFRRLTRKRVEERIARISDADPQRPGLILCNPPYGHRLEPPELHRLYRDLGEWCRQFRGWRAGFFVGNRDFEPTFGGRPRVRKPLNNGSLAACFYLYDL